VKSQLGGGMADMIYILLSALALGVLFLATGCGAEEKNVPEKTVEPNTTPAKGEKPATPVLTREQIKDRLQKLSQMPKPKVEPGAMCYSSAVSQQSETYVCPQCNEKTIYAYAKGGDNKKAQQAAETMSRLRNLSSCRRKIGAINGLAVELDESQFCKKCNPDVAEPKLVLVVHHSGDKDPHRFAGVTNEDLQVLAEFLAGDNKHKSSNDSIFPLVNYLKRLEEMLGVKLETK
jgi:hypothetical protein